PYHLEGEPLLTRLLYEGRKDSLTYVGLAIGVWLLKAVFNKAAVAAPPPTPQTPSRLDIRDGAKRFWIETNEILWIEAAGNYVELHLAARSLLRRQTLAALECELDGCDFVRIHRSRLVNARHVTAAETNDSGDFTITLTDGRQISGSRRWRAGLDILTRR
ncbi:MAG TPA: LytTR family DNA-binding domain-containing protein, partial [Nordella sp.]|nr:LytTR family DNA-binding domain-containing protein [Nordella sp.]